MLTPAGVKENLVSSESAFVQLPRDEGGTERGSVPELRESPGSHGESLTRDA